MSKDPMFLFLTALRRWLPWVTKASYCISVEAVVKNKGEFVVVAKWPATRNGPAGELTIPFTRQKVFGATATKGPLCHRTTKKVCSYRDDIVREILTARGVL